MVRVKISIGFVIKLLFQIATELSNKRMPAIYKFSLRNAPPQPPSPSLLLFASQPPPLPRSLCLPLPPSQVPPLRKYGKCCPPHLHHHSSPSSSPPSPSSIPSPSPSPPIFSPFSSSSPSVAALSFLRAVHHYFRDTQGHFQLKGNDKLKSQINKIL